MAIIKYLRRSRSILVGKSIHAQTRNMLAVLSLGLVHGMVCHVARAIAIGSLNFGLWQFLSGLLFSSRMLCEFKIAANQMTVRVLPFSCWHAQTQTECPLFITGTGDS